MPAAADNSHSPVLWNSRRLAAAALFLWCAAAPAWAQRPLGVDVSDYQGGGINWPAAKSSNSVAFAWAKATEGLTVNDADFGINETNAKAAGVLIGAYHFAHPELHLGPAGADQEASHFWGVAARYVTNGNACLMPMLDVESDLSGASPAYTQKTLSLWVNRWCSDVVNAGASNGVAVKPVIYTYTSYASEWLDSTVTNWPLWMASWPSEPNPQTGAPASLAPWSGWAVWQYSDSNTVAGPVHGWDADVFNGTLGTITNLTVGSLFPPFFMTPLVNSRVVDAGGTVAFSAAADGSRPLSYRWLFNSTNLPAATNASLLISNAQLASAGSYALVVSNAAGSLTSSAVALVVYPLQTAVFADNFDSASATNWIFNRSSTDTVAAFSFDYSTLGIPSAPNSKNGTTRGLQMKANLTNGVAAALSLSPTNQSFTGDYRLHFDAWINVNGPFPNGGNGSTEFLTGGLGTTGARTEWNGSGATADGFYFAADGDGGIAAGNLGLNDYCVFAGTVVEPAASGLYRAGTDATARSADNRYYQTVFTNARTAPLTQRTAYPQQTNALDPGTFGLAWHDVMVSRRGSTVDWAVDGVLMATISNAVFTAGNVFVGFWDPYASLSSNNVINFGLVDNVRVEEPVVAPLFVTNPISQTVKLGANVTFLAAAGGLPAPAYQWQFNGTNLPAATNAAYSLPLTALTNAGTYAVTATNLGGTAVSSNALLAFLPPAPAQFQSIAVTGTAVRMSFTADPYWTYTVETSTNLQNWSVLTNLATTNGAFSFAVPLDGGPPGRFFRASAGR